MKKVIKEFLIVCLFVGLSVDSLAAEAGGESGNNNGGFLASTISTKIPQNAKWDLEVIDIKTGRIMESKTTHNEQNGKLVPASLVKLFTAGAVLNHNGQSPLDMTTTVSIDKKGNLYITGRGNAFLNRRDITKMVVDIAGVNKISKIKGDIIADDTLFDATGLLRTRKGPSYARPNALGMESHTANAEVTPGKVGEAPLVRVMPLNKGVKVVNTAKTVDSNRNTLMIEKLDDKTYRVSGNISKNSRTLRKRFALDDSAIYTAEVLKSLLEEMGVKVKGSVKRGKTPEKTRVLSEVKAMDLNEMVRFMNIHSINLVADNLLLLMGAEKFNGVGTAQKGLSV